MKKLLILTCVISVFLTASVAAQASRCKPPVPTTPPVTQPAPSRCPAGMVPEAGKDGHEGNDECCFRGVNCDADLDRARAMGVVSMLRRR